LSSCRVTDRSRRPRGLTSGIFGHGMPSAAGLALAARLNKLPYHVYVLLGDGNARADCVEGMMTAAKFRLSNLTAIVDFNDVQLDGPVHEVMPLEPLVDKWRAFNWTVLEINGPICARCWRPGHGRRSSRAAHGHHRSHDQG